MSDLGTGDAVPRHIVSCAQYADDDVVQWYAIAQNPVDDAGSGAPAYLKRAGFRCTVLGDEFSSAPRRAPRRAAALPARGVRLAQATSRRHNGTVPERSATCGQRCSAW